MLNYSRNKDVAVLDGAPEQTVQAAYQKLVSIHQFLFPHIESTLLTLRKNGSGNTPVVSFESAACRDTHDVLTLRYSRTAAQSIRVEHFMGRDEVCSPRDVEMHRHPAIEIRITPEYFVMELVVSGDAWYDQQNLMGKLSVDRHRQHFYELIQELDGDYYLGFWSGVDLSDMHIYEEIMKYPRVLNEWLSTFSPEKDNFRLGVWYKNDSEHLSDENLPDELLHQIKSLIPIYEFLLWTSENNYREFFTKA